MKRKLSDFKIAFFDLDGTLLNFNGEVMPGSVEAVQFLRSNGLRISLATGRASFGADVTVERLKIDDFCIFFSGSLIINPASREVLFTAHLSPDDVLTITRICRESGIYEELYTIDDYFIETPGPLTDLHAPFFGRYPQVCNLDELAEGTRLLKATLVAEGPEQQAGLDRMKRELKSANFHVARGATAPVYFANITPPTASRENAFNMVLSHLGITPEQTMAFGDGASDIPFMKMSGLGIALGNAEDSVKEASDYVTSSVNDEGILAAVNHIFRE